MLQMKYNMDRNFGFQDEMDDQLTLVSSRIQSQGRFLVGRMVDGEFHLRPVHAVMRMRPSFQSIDEADREREQVHFVLFLYSSFVRAVRRSIPPMVTVRPLVTFSFLSSVVLWMLWASGGADGHGTSGEEAHGQGRHYQVSTGRK